MPSDSGCSSSQIAARTASLENQRKSEVLTVDFAVLMRTRPQKHRTE